MILAPESKDDLAAKLAAASASGQKISGVDLSRVASLVEHAPEDMTATAEGGMTLDSFQDALGRTGQWLPLDPPHPGGLTLAELLAFDLSGPRRLCYGTARDYLIGIKVALADGQIIKAGGKVVKNVAGYDLCKLFIGARHSLGFIVEANFKLRPLPEAETFLQARFDSLEDAGRAARALLESPVEPILLDGHNLEGAFTVVTGFAGMREDVEFQVAIARELGFSNCDEGRYEANFWNGSNVQKTSVLPSRTVSTIQAIRPAQFVAHLGNGVIYHRGGTVPPELPVPIKLMERVKNAYDPKQILPAYSA